MKRQPDSTPCQNALVFASIIVALILCLQGCSLVPLERTDWPRIEFLMDWTALEVLQIPGIGPKRFEHIERVLKRHGLALRKD